MIMAMSYTLLSYVQGIHKIGTYIQKVIEPRTDGGLRWETYLFKVQTRRMGGWPSEHVVISLGAVVANIGASLGAEYVFLKEAHRSMPALACGFFSVLTLPAVYRMWTSGRERTRYAKQIDMALARDADLRAGSTPQA